MLIYVIRHGETDWNRAHRLQGRTDIPLNEQGLQLARITGEALKNVPFDLCFSSPLTRAMETAREVLKQNAGYAARAEAFAAAHPDYRKMLYDFAGDTPLIREARIEEINFGAWEGLSCDPEHMEVPEKEYRAFFKNPDRAMLPEGAEHIQDVVQRAEAFFHDLTNRRELSDKTVLLATHGCAMRAFLHPLYENQKSFWQGSVPANCEVAVVRAEPGKQAQFVDTGRIYYDPKLAANYKAG